MPRVVQVASEGDAAYARCRDFSDTGMRLDLISPLQLNDMVTVALSPEIMVCGTVAWVNGRECGVVFDDPVDSATLLDASEPKREAPRSLATLDMLDRSWPTHRVPAPRESRRPGIAFEAGLAVTVVVGPNQEQRGTVRWAKDNIAALEIAWPERDIRTQDRTHDSAQGLLPAPE